MVDYTPEKGDVVWLNFEPQQGREITKTRPALVVSPKKYNMKTNLALFMPITSQIKDYPFEIEINLNGKDCVILCDQVRSLDWMACKASKIQKLDEQLFKQAISKLYLLVNG